MINFCFLFLSASSYIVSMVIYLEMTGLSFSALLARMGNHLCKERYLPGKNMEIDVCMLV
jgi:hypothetical protein